MTTAFIYTSGPTTKSILTDRVRVEVEVLGDEYELVDHELEQDVRGVRLHFEVSGVWEDASSGLDGAAAGTLWLDLLNGSEIKIRPDASQTSAEVIILPDLSHQATLLATRLGTIQRGQTLRFKAKSPLLPDSATVEAFRDLMAD